MAALIRLEADLAAAPAGGGLKGLFRKAQSERGVYLWGPVGRGKSMLMDLFFEAVAVEKKRRTHFHVFMGEIHRLIGKTKESGLTIVPLSLYFKNGYAKVEIALARGKKTYDKRHALAEKQADREKQQALGRQLKGMD